MSEEIALAVGDLAYWRARTERAETRAGLLSQQLADVMRDGNLLLERVEELLDELWQTSEARTQAERDADVLTAQLDALSTELEAARAVAGVLRQQCKSAGYCLACGAPWRGPHADGCALASYDAQGGVRHEP